MNNNDIKFDFSPKKTRKNTIEADLYRTKLNNIVETNRKILDLIDFDSQKTRKTRSLSIYSAKKEKQNKDFSTIVNNFNNDKEKIKQFEEVNLVKNILAIKGNNTPIKTIEKAIVTPVFSDLKEKNFKFYDCYNYLLNNPISAIIRKKKYRTQKQI